MNNANHFRWYVQQERERQTREAVAYKAKNQIDLWTKYGDSMKLDEAIRILSGGL